MDLTSLIALIGGPVLSAIIALILGEGFGKQVAVVLTLLTCVAFAACETLLTNGFLVGHPHDALGVAQLVVANIFIVLGGAYTTYEHVLKPTGLDQKLNQIGPQVGASDPVVPAAEALPAPATATASPDPVPTPAPAPAPVIVLNILPGVEPQQIVEALAQAVPAVAPAVAEKLAIQGYSPTPRLP